jgi:alkanesulfonate monooxygenase SsuD/methylene tetrahydromethanopterin reductase-like flavin-dependent oxidoreductase (luciferase family)
MKFGLDVVPFGHYSDPRNVAALARVAEESGWDGVFTWDHLGFTDGVPTGHPWIILAAVASVTSRVRIGPWVTPLPRRRVQVVAQEIAALDLLSGGRLIFGAGIGGVPAEFERFGEDPDLARRAAMLEEGLDVLARLLEGERVDHHGAFYTAAGVTMAPRPLQQPRPPIWIGAIRGRARRRAARWEGWTIPNVDQHGNPRNTPPQLAAKVSDLLALRPAGAGRFDVAITGVTAAGASPLVHDFEAAGATWWLETIHGYRFSPDEALRRVAAGPPR